jgi:hypothetical protein
MGANVLTRLGCYSSLGRRWIRLLVIALVMASFRIEPVWVSAQAVEPAAVNGDEEIVYIDSNGVIRVLDLTQAPGNNQVQWQSPDGGWIDFALGDFNNDGDMEIVAIGSVGGVGRLAVFDPVVTGPSTTPGQVINGIPWELLYQIDLPGIPRLVETGSFDLTVGGDEIIYSYLVNPATATSPELWRFVILRNATTAADGRSWNTLTTHDTTVPWTWIATGNLDGAGIDEVVLIANTVSELSVFRVGNGFTRAYQHLSVERHWRAAAVGQWNTASGSSAEELAVVRQSDFPLHNVLVMGFGATSNPAVLSQTDLFSQYHYPDPDFVFMADLGGNGDQEIVVLRAVPADVTNHARLFVHDNGNDGIAMLETQLDTDNGYLVGAGGDVDGDGRDEIVVMRRERIRVYTEPDRSNNSAVYELPNNGKSIKIGNLDTNGLVVPSRLSVSPTGLDLMRIVGQPNQPVQVAVSNATTGSAIAINTVRVEYAAGGATDWLTVAPTTGNTPMNIMVTPLTDSNRPLGVYKASIIVDTPDTTVANRPLVVPVNLTLTYDIAASPAVVDVFYQPCGANLAVRNVVVQMTSEGESRSFTVQATPVRSWLTVTPPTGSTPSSLTVTINPNNRPADADQTELILRSTVDGNSVEVGRIPVRLLCAQSTLYLPYTDASD